MALISLQDGPTLPIEVIALAVDLENRGFVLRAQDGFLKVTSSDPSKAEVLSDEDRNQIRIWKAHLLAIVSYCEDKTSATTKRDTVSNETSATKRDSRRKSNSVKG